MKVLQSGHFTRAIKRLHPQEKVVLDNAVKALIENPEAGVLKIGDLSGVRVYKFKVNLNRMLLAYLYNKDIDTPTLLAYGSHENFYRDLKKLT
ncbi:type II toxin-antitoxin system RelE/ParE family toxin [Methyloglobulus sp.]|uniref:type II toxin-antitoxin system RelE/ParE family toxin n=1 Tax=Methyloglobulus sp. TaxID=2518622 RepID=UPI00398907F9